MLKIRPAIGIPSMEIGSEIAFKFLGSSLTSGILARSKNGRLTTISGSLSVVIFCSVTAIGIPSIEMGSETASVIV